MQMQMAFTQSMHLPNKHAGPSRFGEGGTPLHHLTVWFDVLCNRSGLCTDLGASLKVVMTAEHAFTSTPNCRHCLGCASLRLMQGNALEAHSH